MRTPETGYLIWPWVYCSSVEKRRLVLPDEAEVVLEPDDLMRVEVAIHCDEVLFRQYIGLFRKEASELPLFMAALRQASGEFSGQDWLVTTMAQPGWYWLGSAYPPKEGKAIVRQPIEIKAGVTSYTITVEAEE